MNHELRIGQSEWKEFVQKNWKSCKCANDCKDYDQRAPHWNLNHLCPADKVKVAGRLRALQSPDRSFPRRRTRSFGQFHCNRFCNLFASALIGRIQHPRCLSEHEGRRLAFPPESSNLMYGMYKRYSTTVIQPPMVGSPVPGDQLNWVTRTPSLITPTQVHYWVWRYCSRAPLEVDSDLKTRAWPKSIGGLSRLFVKKSALMPLRIFCMLSVVTLSLSEKNRSFRY